MADERFKSDWQSSGLRHANGDLYRSIEINQQRFNISTELAQILYNTADWLNAQEVFHHAEES